MNYAVLRKYLPIVVTAVIVAVVAALIYGAFILLSRAGKTELVFSTSPLNTIIEVDGVVVGKSLYVKPGFYDVTARYDGFDDYSQRVAVGREQTTVTIGLTPNSEAATELLAKPEEQVNAESVGGLDSYQKTISRVENNPILDSLPYTNRQQIFSIDYGVRKDDINNTFLLINNSSTNGRLSALRWLQNQDVPIGETDIRFDDYVSPLTDRVQSERGY